MRKQGDFFKDFIWRFGKKWYICSDYHTQEADGSLPYIAGIFYACKIAVSKIYGLYPRGEL
nr:MAG TPA: hypothetical protein [Caudoviricetes sp.]